MKRVSQMKEQNLTYYEKLFSGWYSPKLISRTYKTYEKNMNDILKTELKLRELKICTCCHRFHISTLNELSTMIKTEGEWDSFNNLWQSMPDPHRNFNYIVKSYRNSVK